MKEMHSNNSNPALANGHSTAQRDFKKAVFWISLTVVYALIFQHIHNWLSWNGQNLAAGLVAGLAVAGIIGMALFKPFYRIIDHPPFAISGLLAVAIGTALGTFVTQSAPAAEFTLRYGETGSFVLRSLQLHDVFHSWWFVGFFILLAISLIKISLKKKISLENVGFHLAHLSPIVILVGFWIDYFSGFRGIIHLEEGQAKNVVQVYKGHSSYVGDSTTLPFRIRLDHFEFEKHDPDYRIQIWRMARNPHAMPVSEHEMHETPTPEILASLPLEEMEIHKIYGTDIRFRLVEFYPNFQFEYTYPSVTDTIEAKDPGVQLELKTQYGDAALQLRANQQGRNKIADESILGAWLEFYWELPAELSEGLSKQPIDEKMAQTNRVIFDGKNRKIYELMLGDLVVKPLEMNKFYPMPGQKASGFTVLQLFPDAAYLEAKPVSKGAELLNPVARIEVWDKTVPGSQEAYLYPSGDLRKGGQFMIPNSDYFLALESFRDRETKFYKSDLSVLDENGDAVKQQAIKVNEPMLHGGYRFYQTDYDPNNPSYSGIGVSHEPGLYLIYFGFFVLVAGVTQMFYGKLRNRKASEI